LHFFLQSVSEIFFTQNFMTAGVHANISRTDIPETFMKRPELSRKQITLIMAGSMLTLFLAALDNTIVGTAMPKIIRDLQGMEHYAWPFTAYMLFSTIVLPISGKLADIYGRRKITLLGIAVFMLTSALCGFSRSMTELSILRGFQGIGGGICTSSAFIIVSEIFPLGQRARYMGLIASMFALASIMGPGAGGLITDYLSWRWVFFVNIPLSMIAFFLIFRHLPVIIETDKTRKMDIPGAVFFVLALLPLLLAVSQIGRMPVTSPFMAGLLAFSLLMTILFLRAEKRSAEPLLNLHYFRDGIFTTSVLGSSFAAMAIFGAAIYMPLYIQA
jgi:multidrug resistance protein